MKFYVFCSLLLMCVRLYSMKEIGDPNTLLEQARKEIGFSQKDIEDWNNIHEEISQKLGKNQELTGAEKEKIKNLWDATNKADVLPNIFEHGYSDLHQNISGNISEMVAKSTNLQKQLISLGNQYESVKPIIEQLQAQKIDYEPAARQAIEKAKQSLSESLERPSLAGIYLDRFRAWWADLFNLHDAHYELTKSLAERYKQRGELKEAAQRKLKQFESLYEN